MFVGEEDEVGKEEPLCICVDGAACLAGKRQVGPVQGWDGGVGESGGLTSAPQEASCVSGCV